MSDDDRQTELRRRREQARSSSSRNRRLLPLVLIGLIVLVAGVGVGVLLGQGGGDGGDGGQKPAAASTASSKDGGGAGDDAAVGDGPSTPAKPAPSTPAAAADPTAARNPDAWPRTGAAAQRTKVPILMYHLIAPAPAGTPYPGLWVPPEELEAQVEALEKAGFTGVTLGEVWDAWHGDGRLPERPVVLSFDDGSISQVLKAGPILRDAGWPGVLNLTTDHVGPDGIPAWGVKRLIKQGWDVDSHTITHPDITTLSGDSLREELAGSRSRIKARFGITPRFFCYPAGRNDDASRAAVKAAGYLAATTTEPGLAARSHDPFGLPRLRVDPGLSGAAVVKLAKGSATPSASGGE